jgi:opacity protein-like surface antigen
MQKIRTSLLCVSAAIVIGLGSSAMAADIAVDAEPLADWTGLRIGVGGGYGMVLHDGFLEVQGDVIDEEEGNDLDFDITQDLNDLGDGSGLATVEAGFDFQLGERFVAGIQGDFTFSNFQSEARHLTIFDPDGNIDFEGPETYGLATRVELDDIWTVAARFGFLSSPETLWYGLIGWSWANVDVKGALLLADEEDDPLETFDILDDDESVGGITFGGGIETMLTQNFTLKVEGRYTNLDNVKGGCTECDIDIDGENVVGTVDDIDYKFDSNILSVRAVLSWRLPIL